MTATIAIISPWSPNRQTARRVIRLKPQSSRARCRNSRAQNLPSKWNSISPAQIATLRGERQYPAMSLLHVSLATTMTSPTPWPAGNPMLASCQNQSITHFRTTKSEVKNINNFIIWPTSCKRTAADRPTIHHYSSGGMNQSEWPNDLQ